MCLEKKLIFNFFKFFSFFLFSLSPSMKQKKKIKTQLMEMEDVSQAYMDFTITEEVYGATNTIELVPGGNDMDVDNSNVREYVQALVKYHMLDSIKDQLSEFLQGKHFFCFVLALHIFSLCSLPALYTLAFSLFILPPPSMQHAHLRLTFFFSFSFSFSLSLFLFPSLFPLYFPFYFPLFFFFFFFFFFRFL